jgi:mRNA-degrading endonuclease RelE of RelBE toxin-antitoxin system
MPKSKPRAHLNPEALADLKRVPGNLRRRMIVTIDALEENPRPTRSKRLEIEGESREIRRLRLDKWRVIYLVLEEQTFILAIRKRPPYNYDDLKNLIEE